VIVGDGAAGKTSLLNVFAVGHFPESYVSPQFVLRSSKNLRIRPEEVGLTWDRSRQCLTTMLRRSSWMGSRFNSLCGIRREMSPSIYWLLRTSTAGGTCGVSPQIGCAAENTAGESLIVQRTGRIREVETAVIL
jgi:GTPase SAR1 family protein